MKKLGIEGLGAVWIKIFSLIQLVTGNVDVKNKGDLQTQINRLDQKIPSAANNGKLTIQKNGADIQSFTANQSGDATANIIVPNTTRSAAVTQEGQLALDAIEKNAAVPGTLAYDLAQTNSKLAPTWGEAAVNTDVVTTAGLAGIQWHKRGGVCTVYVNAKINISSNHQAVLLASDIPYAVFGYEPRGIVIDTDTGRAFVLKVTNRTNLSIYTGTGAPYQGTVTGFIVYVCSNQ